MREGEIEVRWGQTVGERERERVREREGEGERAIVTARCVQLVVKEKGVVKEISPLFGAVNVERSKVKVKVEERETERDTERETEREREGEEEEERERERERVVVG